MTRHLPGKWLLLIGCLLLAAAAGAQKIRFTDSSSQWRVLWTCDTDVTVGCQPYADWYGYTGDTTVYNISYKKLGVGGLAAYLVREDTVQRKVYLRLTPLSFATIGTGADTGEVLLYDYNLQPGDTFSHYYSGNRSFVYYVSAIDSVQLNGVYHRVWRMQNDHARSWGSSIDNYAVIEGVGSLGGPWFSAYPYLFEHTYMLLCYHHNGGGPVPAPAVAYDAGKQLAFDNATSCTLGVEKQSLPVFSVAPNPAPSGSTVCITAGSAARFSVTDMTGREVCRGVFAGKYYLSLAGWQPGVYQCRLVAAGKMPVCVQLAVW